MIVLYDQLFISPNSSVGRPLDLKNRGCEFDFRAGKLNNY